MREPRKQNVPNQVAAAATSRRCTNGQKGCTISLRARGHPACAITGAGERSGPRLCTAGTCQVWGCLPPVPGLLGCHSERRIIGTAEKPQSGRALGRKRCQTRLLENRAWGRRSDSSHCTCRRGVGGGSTRGASRRVRGLSSHIGEGRSCCRDGRSMSRCECALTYGTSAAGAVSPSSSAPSQPRESGSARGSCTSPCRGTTSTS